MSNILNEFKIYQLLEGVNDPAIFKVVFLAGGPGSGKSFIVGKTALSSLGFTVINSDDAFEYMMRKNNLDFKMPDSEKEVRDAVRDRAKASTKLRQKLALQGRLGMVIDGTGKDFDKIQRLRVNLAALGYDAAMIFVNTNIETSLARNRKRERSVPDEIARKGWQDVQDNIGKFQQFFGDRFFVIDNSEGVSVEQQTMRVYKKIAEWAKKPPTNTIGKKWIEDQKKSRGMTEATDEEFIDLLSEDVEQLAEQTYFATMADAVQFARLAAEKKGYEIDADDWFQKVNVGPKKPSAGKTNSYNIKLKKGGKETKRGLAIQVYGMDSGKFELNSYIS